VTGKGLSIGLLRSLRRAEEISQDPKGDVSRAKVHNMFVPRLADQEAQPTGDCWVWRAATMPGVVMVGAVVAGVVLGGAVNCVLAFGWKRLAAPRGRHRA